MYLSMVGDAGSFDDRGFDRVCAWNHDAVTHRSSVRIYLPAAWRHDPAQDSVRELCSVWRNQPLWTHDRIGTVLWLKHKLNCLSLSSATKFNAPRWCHADPPASTNRQIRSPHEFAYKRRLLRRKMVLSCADSFEMSPSRNARSSVRCAREMHRPIAPKGDVTGDGHHWKK